jgi:hypothetical protein
MTVAAFRHHSVREGFEVVRVDGDRFEGVATGLEDGLAYGVHYAIELDAAGRTRRARVATLGAAARTIAVAGGHWEIDGAPAPHLDGLLDLDLEASAVTNAFPVRRLALAPGEAADAPAAWLRLDGTFERLEQHYRRLDRTRYAYSSPDFAAELVYGEDGLIRDYPGIATRIG